MTDRVPPRPDEDRPVSVADRGRSDDLKSQAASGARWGIINQVIQQSTKMVVQVVLARVLAPEQFGIMATALIVVNLGQLLNGLGFGPALVQRKQLTEAHVRAAFTGSLLLGVVFTVASFFGAHPLARYFDEDGLGPVLQTLSIIFIFKSIESVPNDMLRRHLRFREYVLSSSWAAVVSAVVSVVAATVFDAGVWALVIYALTDAFVAMALGCLYALRAGVWRPAVTLDWPATRDLTRFSMYVTTARVFSFMQLNGDNFVVSKVLGADALGAYNQAYRLFLFPIQKVAQVLGQVAMPTFASVQEDVPRLRRGFLTGLRYTACVTVPLSLGMAVSAPYLIPVLLGSGWEAAVTPLQILALTGPRAALTQLNSNIWQAIGKPQWSLWTAMMMGPATIVGVLVGVDHGVAGVATGVAIASYATLPPSTWLAGKAIQSSGWTVVRAVLPIFGAGALMAGAAWGASRLLGDGASDVVHLLTMVATGSVVYFAALAVVDRPLLIDIADQLRGPLRSRLRR